MNNARRKDINKAVGLLEEAKSILEGALGEEQDYRDNMPENLQQSEKADIADSAIDNLENTVDKLQEALDAIEEAVESAAEAAG